GPRSSQDTRTSRRRLSPAVFAILVVAGCLNVFLVGKAIDWTLNQRVVPAWALLDEAARRVVRGEPLYVWNDWYHYRWSPLAAGLFVAIAPIGVVGWRIAQFAAAATLPDRRLALLTLASWPFWYDVETGNTVVFTFVLSVWALGGSRIAQLAYLALLVLIPRPVAVPVAAWLLWKEPDLRRPFGLICAAGIVPVLTLGAAGA